MVEKVNPDVTRKPKGVLGWSIVSTVLGFLPIGAFAIAMAIKSRELWKKGEYEQADVAANKADILSLVAVGVNFIIWICLVLFSVITIGSGPTLIALLLLVLSGLVGMLEGMHRTCGLAGGFILGMFPIIGWILVSVIPWKGEVLDSWRK